METLLLPSASAFSDWRFRYLANQGLINPAMCSVVECKQACSRAIHGILAEIVCTVYKQMRLRDNNSTLNTQHSILTHSIHVDRNEQPLHIARSCLFPSRWCNCRHWHLRQQLSILNQEY